MADNEYVNISVEDFSEEVQALAETDRQMYKAHKAHKAKLLDKALIRPSFEVPLKDEERMEYARWRMKRDVVRTKKESAKDDKAE